MGERDAKDLLAQLLRLQAQWCRILGSPLYQELLLRAAADVEAGGPTWEVLKGHEEDPPTSALALRLMGSVHRLVLSSEAPDLARFFPSAGGRGLIEQAWPAFRSVLSQQCERLRQLVTRPVQTNEVGRSAALLGGFLLIAREARLPLRLLEIGASAGLNLRWDKYRYEGNAGTWGHPASPVVLRGGFTGTPPPLDAAVQISERRGCDLHPVDPSTEEGRLTLMSYIWADQVGRLRLLRAALEIAAEIPAVIDRNRAVDWLEKVLSDAAEDVVSVVFHSIVLQYIEPSEQQRLFERIQEAGRRATRRAPVAWLRMEPGEEQADVHLTIWPGGRERRIAMSSFHGTDVRWLV